MVKEIITYDKATGEVLEGKFYSSEQLEAIKNTKNKQILKNKSDNTFTFVEMDGIQKGLKDLNIKDLGYLLVMQTYIDYNNLMKCSPDSKLPMSRVELQEKLKVGSYKTVVNLIQRFKKQGILVEKPVEMYGKKHKGFYLSDEYCFRKTSDNKNRKTDRAVKLFMSDLQGVYAQTDIKPADVGFIYATIPYLHYSSNFLVHNPYEKDPSKADYVTISDLAEQLNMSRQMVSARLSKLIYNNKYVYSRTKVGGLNEVKVKANPFIISRKRLPEELAFEFYVTPPNK